MANDTGLFLQEASASMAGGAISLPFDNSYARLAPTPVAQPRLIKLNTALAAELGLDAEALASPQGVAVLAGNRIAGGSEPIALAYAGHQFGNFVPQLGDGRAVLLGEVVGRDGIRRDIQLKGSGPTPFSRRGDGRAALAALGVPTTRSLAAVMTGEPVMRETALPGAVLTRVASSHIRVGTFQFFAARGDLEALKLLADHAIARHYPDARSEAEPHRALFDRVIARQAELVAQWMLVGFIHGVMNTDNCSIAGETIDYGPCAFMDAYDPGAVFSSIDQQGRYAYGNQPHAALWNLARFAETLLPIIDASADRAVELASEALATFATRFSDLALAGVRRKLGLSSREDGDAALAEDLLDAMHRNQADFTLTFRRLCDAAEEEAGDTGVGSLFLNPREYDAWASRWRARTARDPAEPRARAEAMRQVNPAVIPRNHRIEQAINAAVEGQDFEPFAKLSAVLSQPYRSQEGFESYADPPQPGERVHKTFCGT